jgi:hypothetical protein
MDKKITIEKVGETPKPVILEKPKGGRKTIKTFPKGVLKRSAKLHLKGVADPAKSTMKRHTLRMLTEKGMRKHRKSLKRRLAKIPDKKVKEIVEKSGLVTNSKTPPGISRQIMNNAVSAGFLSV